MNEAVDVRSISQTLYRHRRFLVVAGCAGLLLAGAYAFMVPSRFTSTALVLLPPSALSSSGEPTRQVSTQARIVTSVPVMAAAGKQVSPPLDADHVSSRVTVKTPTADIVQIRASDRSGTTAQQLATALAKAYITFLTSGSTQESAPLTQLKQRRDVLGAQLRDLQSEIAKQNSRLAADPHGSLQASQDAGTLATLHNEQSTAAEQLAEVEGSITQIQQNPGSGGTGAGSGSTPILLQPGTTGTRASTTTRVAEWAVAGAAAAFLLACVGILIASRRDQRLLLRDQMASAAGAPVLGSLAAHPGRDTDGWTSMLRGFDPPTSEAWALRKTLRNIGIVDLQPGSSATLLILCLAKDRGGLALAPQLAAFCAAHGVPTVLSCIGSETSAASLWAACGRAQERPLRPGLSTSHVGGEGEVPPGSGAGLTLHLIVLDRERPELSELPPADLTLLSLAAGAATAEELARVAVAADDAGHAIGGVLVADPAPDDITTGLFPQRSMSPAVRLPTRLTGLGTGSSR